LLPRRANHDLTVISVRRKPAECVGCGRISGPYWWRWRAYTVDAPEPGGAPGLAIYCQTCANRTFGMPRRRALPERRRPADA
jgi:hypothetical protein